MDQSHIWLIHILTDWLQNDESLLICIVSQLQEWFTPFHLIDITMVAMVWVTRGFCCSNHEIWVITESDKHFVLFNIWPTFAERYRQCNNIGMMSQWRGFRCFIDETFAELMRFVSRFADLAAAVTANQRHLPPQRASGLRLRFPSLIYGCSCLHPPQPVAFLPCLTLPCLWSGK